MKHAVVLGLLITSMGLGAQGLSTFSGQARDGLPPLTKKAYELIDSGNYSNGLQQFYLLSQSSTEQEQLAARRELNAMVQLITIEPGDGWISNQGSFIPGSLEPGQVPRPPELRITLADRVGKQVLANVDIALMVTEGQAQVTPLIRSSQTGLASGTLVPQGDQGLIRVRANLVVVVGQTSQALGPQLEFVWQKGRPRLIAYAIISSGGTTGTPSTVLQGAMKANLSRGPWQFQEGQGVPDFQINTWSTGSLLVMVDLQTPGPINVSLGGRPSSIWKATGNLVWQVINPQTGMVLGSGTLGTYQGQGNAAARALADLETLASRGLGTLLAQVQGSLGLQP